MKAINRLGVAGDIGLGLVLASLLIERGAYPSKAMPYSGAILAVGTAIGAHAYYNRHRG